MAFREKMSWLSLGGILLAFGPYFFSIVVLHASPIALTPASAGPFLMAILALVCVMIVASIAIALTNVRDAQVPSDERDRLIARRGVAFAYPVLLTGIYAALTTLLFRAGETVLINAILGAIVLGEVTRCAVEIAGYRARG